LQEQRRERIGADDLTVRVNYGGLSEAQAESGMRAFARDVLAEVQSWA